MILFHFLSGDRARRSPRKLPTAMKEERKKWVMPKFLPHKYDVKLISEDKVCILLSAVNKNKNWSRIDCILYFSVLQLMIFGSLVHNWSLKIQCLVHDLLRSTQSLSF